MERAATSVVCERDEANRERGGWDALRLCEKLARGPRVRERGGAERRGARSEETGRINGGGSWEER